MSAILLPRSRTWSAPAGVSSCAGADRVRGPVRCPSAQGRTMSAFLSGVSDSVGADRVRDQVT